MCVLDEVSVEPDTKDCGSVWLLVSFLSLRPWWAKPRRIEERYVTTGDTINAHEPIGLVRVGLRLVCLWFSLGKVGSGIDIKAKRSAKRTPGSLIYPLA
jgi:hypothetical protein